MKIEITDEIAGKVRIAYLVLEDVVVTPENPLVLEAIEELSTNLKAQHGDSSPAEIPGVQEARSLYRSIGIDPTKNRPSSEALLRRVLKDKGLYRVNSLVDAVNWASLTLLLPFGLYDLGRTEGDVVLRTGHEGESYEGIRRGPIHVGGRFVLTDDTGPFGNPTADSMRTMVTEETRRVLVIIFVPGTWGDDQVDSARSRIEEELVRFSGGRLQEAGASHRRPGP